MQHYARSFLRPSLPEPPTVALVGCFGFNAGRYVIPAFARLDGRVRFVGYDVQVPEAGAAGFRWLRVRDNDDLARQLAELRPTHALLETTDPDHPVHIQAALDAGARHVISEKCLAAHSADVARHLPGWQARQPEQQVRVLDHYLLLELVQLLYANTDRWLGEVQRVQVTLLESQGVPPHQVRSHAGGMANFFHHGLALAGLWFDLDALIPLEAAWARHPDAPVPDTYRWARFGSARTGTVVLEVEVGKYVPQPRKRVVVQGSEGRAVFDRHRNELHVTRHDGESLTVRRDGRDSGYGELARAIATGAPLPALLMAEQALTALRLIEAAHGRARELPAYPDGRGDGFVCEWQMPAGPVEAC